MASDWSIILGAFIVGIPLAVQAHFAAKTDRRVSLLIKKEVWKRLFGLVAREPAPSNRAPEVRQPAAPAVPPGMRRRTVQQRVSLRDLLNDGAGDRSIAEMIAESVRGEIPEGSVVEDVSLSVDPQFEVELPDGVNIDDVERPSFIDEAMWNSIVSQHRARPSQPG